MVAICYATVPTRIFINIRSPSKSGEGIADLMLRGWDAPQQSSLHIS